MELETGRESGSGRVGPRADHPNAGAVFTGGILSNEAQARFKQRIDSRVAYSSAKTGLDYLKLKLSTCDLAGAVIALREVHFNKHQAELFDELDEWLAKKFSPAITRDEWGGSMFEYLNGTKRVLEANAGSWDALSPAQRMQLLDPVLPANLYPNRMLPHPSAAVL